MEEEVQQDNRRYRILKWLMLFLVLLAPSIYTYKDYEVIQETTIQAFLWTYSVELFESNYYQRIIPDFFLFFEPIILLYVPTFLLVWVSLLHYRRELNTVAFIAFALLSAAVPWLHYVIPVFLTLQPDVFIFFPFPSIVAILLSPFKEPSESWIG